jgi:type IV secretion system protein VirD4
MFSPRKFTNLPVAARDDGDADAVQATALSPSMQGIARSVTIDPDDPMDL